MLTKSDLASLVKDQMIPDWRNERDRLDRIDRWYRWDPEEIQLPRQATPELRALRNLSRVPWLGLVVTSTAQCMYVDGFRSALDEPSSDRDGVEDGQVPEPVGPYRVWLANAMDQKQVALHRAMLAYGYAFATCLPGEDFLGRPMPVLRGVSPRKMWAVWEDPADDDWPRYAMQVLRSNESGHRVKVFDEVNVYTLTVPSGIPPDGEDLIIESVQQHDAGVCPVVRYAHELDLDGRTRGEVEPYIPLAARINKTSYDRMLTQHYNSWKIRYIAGLAAPDTEEGAVRQAMKLSQMDLLVSEDPDTKFGALPETSMSGFIDAHMADVETLAAVSQTPTHELTGKLINVSAEGLAMIRASQMQKVYETQKSAGRSHVQLLRLASALEGDTKYAEDVTGRVTWQDTSIRSMAQAVDALVKLSTLEVPSTALWQRIPGVEKSDVDDWIRLAKEGDPIDRMRAELERQAEPSQRELPEAD